jgi:hypothetical protein
VNYVRQLQRQAGTFQAQADAPVPAPDADGGDE